MQNNCVNYDKKLWEKLFTNLPPLLSYFDIFFWLCYFVVVVVFVEVLVLVVVLVVEVRVLGVEVRVLGVEAKVEVEVLEVI